MSVFHIDNNVHLGRSDTCARNCVCSATNGWKIVIRMIAIHSTENTE